MGVGPMNADSTNTPITDDPDLAKVLADMNGKAKEADTTKTDDTAAVTAESSDKEEPSLLSPISPDFIATPPPSPAAPTVTSSDPGLESIKKNALEELKPLVGKLDLPADEKFDTLLLIIRSTDDKSLVQATYDAAKAITDETKRAQALLDVIKEIDYFSTQPATTIA